MRLLILAIASLLLVGCNGRVLVADPAGNPIEGASLIPMAPSLDGRPSTTNSRGEAWVSYHVGLQKTQWIKVSKPGFEDSNTDVTTAWPESIVLQPSGAPPRP